MELNWTTFILETINFFVLVWLMKRFFYRPVKRAIENRKQNIEKTMREAEDIRANADELESRYRNRIQDWEQEKEMLRASFIKEIEKEKRVTYEKFQIQLDGERKQIIQQEKQKGEETVMKAQNEAFSISLEFISRLLEKLTGPELEEKLTGLAIEQLVSDKMKDSMKNIQLDDSVSEVVCKSVFPVKEKHKDGLRNALENILNRNIQVVYDRDPSLIAGIEITAGSYVVQANLRNELRLFAQTEEI